MSVKWPALARALKGLGAGAIRDAVGGAVPITTAYNWRNGVTSPRNRELLAMALSEVGDDLDRLAAYMEQCGTDLTTVIGLSDEQVASMSDEDLGVHVRQLLEASDAAA
jgi:hypothetical protein